MTMTVFAVEGLTDLGPIAEIQEHVRMAAIQAINKTAEHSRTLGARRIGEQVALSASYLSQANGRLVISKKAQGLSLSAAITGRFRPTSLARFSKGAVPGQRGAKVTVKPGHLKQIPRGFFIRLRSGAVLTETQYNLGLAIRLKPGERLINKKQFVQLGKNLYLLYGPSVDQVFRSVAPEISPDAAEFLEREFKRLMDRRNDR